MSENSTARKDVIAADRRSRRKLLNHCTGSTSKEGITVGKMGRGANWTAADDVLLCTAYLDVSQDPLTGADQTKAHFWAKIMAFIKNENDEKAKAARKNGKSFVAADRSVRSSQSRFAAINMSVTKFAAAHAQAQRHAASGTNDKDLERAAFELYRGSHPDGKSFEFQECWCVLRTVPRWGSDPPTPATPPVSDPTPESHSEVIGSPRFSVSNQSGRGRPIGVKKTRQDLQEGKDLTKQINTLQAQQALSNKRARILQRQVALGYFKLDLGQVPIEMRDMFLKTRSKLMKELDDEDIVQAPPEAAIATPTVEEGLEANSPVTEAFGYDNHARYEGEQGYAPHVADPLYAAYEGEEDIEGDTLAGQASSSQMPPLEGSASLPEIMSLFIENMVDTRERMQCLSDAFCKELLPGIAKEMRESAVKQNELHQQNASLRAELVTERQRFNAAPVLQGGRSSSFNPTKKLCTSHSNTRRPVLLDMTNKQTDKDSNDGWRDTRTLSGKASGLICHDSFLDTPQHLILTKLAVDREEHQVIDKAKSNDEGFISPRIATQVEQSKQKNLANIRPLGSPLIKFNEVVRNKAERESLLAVECKQCVKFYDAVAIEGACGVHEYRCEHLKAVSRHRYKHLPPNTPEGFWDIGFPDSEL